MNPLKKTLLGILFGFPIGIIVTQGTGNASLINSCLFVLYTIGVIFGWRIILPLVGKVFNIGTDLTFWLLFLCLFRRGFMWASLTLILIFAFAFGIGCWIGGFVCLWEIFKYIIGRRNDWKRKSVFPYAESDAYSLILCWFAKFNNQRDLNDNDFIDIQQLYPQQKINYDFIANSMNNNEMSELYVAISIFKNHSQKQELVNNSLILLHCIMILIARSNQFTYQAREFLLLLIENSTVSWAQFAGFYQQEFGKELPFVDDPSLSLSAA